MTPRKAAARWRTWRLACGDLLSKTPAFMVLGNHEGECGFYQAFRRDSQVAYLQRWGTIARKRFFLDVRAGVAGAGTKAALSLASGAALAAIILAGIGMLGLFDRSLIRIFSEPVGLSCAVALGGFLWCVVLSLIWGTYQRVKNLFRLILSILGLWLIASMGVAWVESTYPSSPAVPLLRAGFILAALAGMLTVLARVGYQRFGARTLVDDAGDVRVNCPRCDYSMRGLSECRCPECGTIYTLDALIRLQDYDARGVRQISSPPPAKSLPDALAEISPPATDPGLA